MRLRKPTRLRPGDRVAVIAPSSPFDRERFEAGLSVLGEAGLTPVFEPGIFERRRYLAGDDARRLGELQRAISDPAVRALWPARGGYGAMRLLARLDATSLQRDPKILVGFSDVMALHALWAKAGVQSVHGPMVAWLAKEPAGARRVLDMVTRPGPPPALQGRAVAAGTAEGVVWGGNLAMLSQLVGTPWMPSLAGALLVLEDVGERPYRLDRMWTHLQLAGALEGVAGVALGSFTECEEKDADYGPDEVIEELAASLGVPVAAGLQFGHGEVNMAVPLGVRARLDGGTLEFLEGPVE